MKSTLFLATLTILITSLITKAATSTTSPPTAPPPPPQQGCRGHDGNIIDGLTPGGEWTSQSGCTVCRCGSDGRATCMSAACPRPECADPVSTPGVCCPSCPNGYTCKTPKGAIIKKGENVFEDETYCTCIPGVNKFNMRMSRRYAGPSATCMSLSDAVCRFANGTVFEGLRPMDSIQVDACTECTCSLNGDVECGTESCEAPSCEDPFVPDGKCCAVCPSPDCTDSSNRCRYWASINQCTQNSVWMLPNCRKSCAVCDSPCTDTDERCEGWARDGYCVSNPVWMLENCTKSCNACSPKNE